MNHIKEKLTNNPIYNSIKTIKSLVINLTKEVKDLCIEKYKTLIKEIEDVTKKKKNSQKTKAQDQMASQENSIKHLEKS